MGKQKRARQKYHLACVKAKDNENETEQTSARNNEIKQDRPVQKAQPLSWNIQPSDNIFTGLDIDISQLKKSLMDTDDDGKSVRSISKSIKSCSGKQLKKADKHKLRHNLFIQKIDAIYEKIKDAKKKKKSKQKKEEVKEKSTVEFLLDKTSPIKIKNAPHISTKLRGIKKSKQRKETMLKDVNLFKKILMDPKFVSKPLDHIRNAVQDKVVGEIV